MATKLVSIFEVKALGVIYISTADPQRAWSVFEAELARGWSFYAREYGTKISRNLRFTTEKRGE